MGQTEGARGTGGLFAVQSAADLRLAAMLRQLQRQRPVVYAAVIVLMESLIYQ